jgi:hypothetical protein
LTRWAKNGRKGLRKNNYKVMETIVKHVQELVYNLLHLMPTTYQKKSPSYSTSPRGEIHRKCYLAGLLALFMYRREARTTITADKHAK